MRSGRTKHRVAPNLLLTLLIKSSFQPQSQPGFSEKIAGRLFTRSSRVCEQSSAPILLPAERGDPSCSPASPCPLSQLGHRGLCVGWGESPEPPVLWESGKHEPRLGPCDPAGLCPLLLPTLGLYPQVKSTVRIPSHDYSTHLDALAPPGDLCLLQPRELGDFKAKLSDQSEFRAPLNKFLQ